MHRAHLVEQHRHHLERPQGMYPSPHPPPLELHVSIIVLHPHQLVPMPKRGHPSPKIYNISFIRSSKSKLTNQSNMMSTEETSMAMMLSFCASRRVDHDQGWELFSVNQESSRRSHRMISLCPTCCWGYGNGCKTKARTQHHMWLESHHATPSRRDIKGGKGSPNKGQGWGVKHPPKQFSNEATL